MMSEGTKNIVEAMKARGISKVIGCMSGMPRCVKKKRKLKSSSKSVQSIIFLISFLPSLPSVGSLQSAATFGSCDGGPRQDVHRAEDIRAGLCGCHASSHWRSVVRGSQEFWLQRSIFQLYSIWKKMKPAKKKVQKNSFWYSSI